MQFSLFNREFSARLELYSKLETEDRKKLSQKCETFYVINNKASCELDEELVKFEQAKIYEFDHV